MEWGEVFPMAAGAVKTGWLTALFGGMLVLWVGLFFFLSYLVRGASQAEVALRRGHLVVRGGVYGREIPLGAVDASGLTRLDLADGAPKYLKWRTNGLGLPGLAAGWYRLGDGEKALVFVTDKDRAVYVPTRLGFAVVVSPDNPTRFLEALRRACAGAGPQSAPSPGVSPADPTGPAT